MESNWHDTGGVRERAGGREGGAVCQQLHNSGCHYALSSYTRRKRDGHYHHIITAMLREQQHSSTLMAAKTLSFSFIFHMKLNPQHYSDSVFPVITVLNIHVVKVLNKEEGKINSL